MMLSELYGRIGQMLQEHGDAPIGYHRQPTSEPPYTESDYIKPKYVEPYLQMLEVDGVTIKCYELNFY
jgi:hypothetical protein